MAKFALLTPLTQPNPISSSGNPPRPVPLYPLHPLKLAERNLNVSVMLESKLTSELQIDLG